MLNDANTWKSLTARTRLTLIAGRCVIENARLCLRVASAFKRTGDRLGIFYLVESSFDKAGLTSTKSFRGTGLEAGLEVLANVPTKTGMPVLTDIHTEAQAAIAGKAVEKVRSAGGGKHP